MKSDSGIRFLIPIVLFICGVPCSSDTAFADTAIPQPIKEQVPAWTSDDLEFFLHGSMSTEMVPEAVLWAFIRAYPDLFPNREFANLGLISDRQFGWPVGFSRRNIRHLGGLSSVGVNCASCHVGEVVSSTGSGAPVRVLGMTSHFDAEGFFGAVITSGFRIGEPSNMRKFLSAYVVQLDPTGGLPAQIAFVRQWELQEKKIAEAITADPTGSKGIAAGEFHSITEQELRPDKSFLEKGGDLAALSHSMLKLMHNMRAALHVPDVPPAKAPPSSGPGRNDAFGLLSAVLFGEPQPYAPVKYGLVWNIEHRHWVHWDGNTQSPIGRNLLASLGLGAPLMGKHGELDFAMVKRQTELSEKIQAPKYPFTINTELAGRGAARYKALCADCHTGPEGDSRLHAISEIGTDPRRAEFFTPKQAKLFSAFLAELETPGYAPGDVPGIRSTQKYWAATLTGVWARSPYLHNGSVRTLAELLSQPADRPKTFHRGTKKYDEQAMGYLDDGNYLFDTTTEGNANSGHDYGTRLSAGEKAELIEYLKTL